MATLGWYLVLFLVTFLTFEDSLFQIRLEVFGQGLRIIAGTGIFASLFYILSFRTSLGALNEILMKFKYHRSNVRDYLIFTTLLILDIIIKHVIESFYVLNFVIFLVAATVLFFIARRYASDPVRPSWRHPTTIGGILEGSFALGLSTGLWFFNNHSLSSTLAWLLLFTLLLESMTLWGRFHFLSHSVPINRLSLRMMLGSHVALFGIRFIFGLIMPLVYLFWVLLVSKDLPFHPVILMVFVGEISERILFFITSLEEKEHHSELNNMELQ